jgi:glycosyltransferase involved in cell wall biosynthesis
MNFSVIIPFRNEKENLDDLLRTLTAQKTRSNYEIIMVDDYSDDGGCEIVKKYDAVKLLRRKDFADNPSISSKQNALDIGVSFARYDFLLFTDADMVFDENWIENYRISIEKTEAKFIFSRTQIHRTKNFFEILQKTQLDFLFAAAFVFCKLNFDGSAMGNNLAISKDVYKKIGGQNVIGFSLVEDKKLLSIARKNKIKIFCTQDFSAYAFTKPVSPKKFLHQTLRWVKGGFLESKFLTVVLLIFALGNLFIVPSFILILLLLPVFLKNKISIKYVLLLPFMFFIETIIITWSLFFVKLRWKNIEI